MKKGFYLALSGMVFSVVMAGPAHAKKQCTEEPKEKWMSVEDFKKKYNTYPSYYGAQSYDAIMLIASAVEGTKGDTANKNALRAEMKKANFKSLRGDFKFNTNHYPIQDFYLVKVAKRADGKFQTEIVQKVFSDYKDPHVADCAMK